MIATMLGLLSKFFVFLGKWLTVALKSWHHTFEVTKMTWNKIASDLMYFIQYGMHNMLLSLG